MMYRIIWSEVYGYFISSENITLRACSEKYDINYDTLRQKASKEAWSWKKENIFQNALTMMNKRTSAEIAKRNLAQIQFAQALLAKAAQALAAGIMPQNAKEIRQWIETGINVERAALGLNKLTTPTKKYL